MQKRSRIREGLNAKVSVDIVPCHKLLLTIDSFGNVYPCCRQIASSVFANINDQDCLEKVLGYIPEHDCICSIGRLGNKTGITSILHINIELAGPCNGGCFYCFQKNYTTFNRKILILEKLEQLLLAVKPKSLMIFGGEIGVQHDTISMLENIYNDFMPSICIATNGFINKFNAQRLFGISRELQVTFNGFSESTVKGVSRIEFTSQKSFVIEASKYTNVSIKYLVNPANIIEIPVFFEWALRQKPEHLIVDTTILRPQTDMRDDSWGHSLLQLCDNRFIKSLFDSIKNNVWEILHLYAEWIRDNEISLLICSEVLDYLGIDTSFFAACGLEKNLSPKNVAISSKAWKTLL